MKRRRMRGGVAWAALLGFGLFAACGGDDDDTNGGDGDGDGDGDLGDGDFSFSGGFGDGDGDTGDGDSACGGEEVEAAPLKANVLLVVDTSTSMTQQPTGFTDTKWNTLVASLDVALPEVQDLLGLGLKMFPSGDSSEDACNLSSGIEVEVGAGAEVLGDIQDALEAETPEGQTPTAAALADALAYFQSSEGMALEGDNYVLLATDGGPNCNDMAADCTCASPGPVSMGNDACGEPTQCTTNLDGNAPCLADGSFDSCCLPSDRDLCLDDAGTLDAVTDLAEAGIKTIVLGMPGTEAYADVLDALAEAGGLPSGTSSPKYVKVDDAAGLTESLRSVTRNLVRSCEIALEEKPQNYNKVNVYLDGEVIPKDDDDGWKYDESTDPFTVVLTGPTCTEVEETGVEKITVEFGCDTIVVR